ncbi:MAG: hypothetical protein P1P80_01045 [ANME-2 cluster archaeon]|nr:hypothetical protein [ANME-2 cluster archaeon]
MVYTLQALHDMNTGIILVTLALAYLKSRTAAYSHLGLAALVLFIISLLPTPIHGTGILGIGVMIFTYAFVYYNWQDKEIRGLALVALLVIMLNVVIGFRLRGLI